MEKIFEEIREERERQDAKWGGPSHDDTHALEEWGNFIQDHLDKALEAPSAEQERYQLIRIAALAVAAVETYNRCGVGPLYRKRESDDQA